MIDSFTGEYRFLSNFHPSPIRQELLLYPTVEHFFQAMKSLNYSDRARIAALPTPGQAKRAGRGVNLRKDWMEKRDAVMLYALRKKFEYPTLRQKLLNTHDRVLIEGNTWGDTYWGVCRGIGKNTLGKLLMQVREEIRSALFAEQTRA